MKVDLFTFYGVFDEGICVRWEYNIKHIKIKIQIFVHSWLTINKSISFYSKNS